MMTNCVVTRGLWCGVVCVAWCHVADEMTRGVWLLRSGAACGEVKGYVG